MYIYMYIYIYIYIYINNCKQTCMCKCIQIHLIWEDGDKEVNERTCVSVIL